MRHLAHLSEDQIFFLDRALLRAHTMSGVYAKSKLVDADTQSCTHCIYKFTCCMRVCLRDRFCLPARAPDQHLAVAELGSCRSRYQAHSQRAKTIPNTRAMSTDGLIPPACNICQPSSTKKYAHAQLKRLFTISFQRPLSALIPALTSSALKSKKLPCVPVKVGLVALRDELEYASVE